MIDRLFAVFALAGLTVTPLLAAEINAVDPKAETVLRSLSAFFQTAPSFKVDMEAETKIEAEDMKQEFTTRATLAVKRPDKLAMSVKNGMIGSMLLVCDGSNTTSFLPTFKRYTVRPASGSLDNLCQDMDGSSPACLPIVSALMHKDPYQALVAGVSRIQYLGEEKRGDLACHHLTFTHPDFDCDAWILTGPKPLLVAVKPSLAKMACLTNMPPGMKTDVILNLVDWEIGPSLPDSIFEIALPAEAQKTDALFPGMTDTNQEDADEEPDPSEALRLKPAPLFTLPLLGGGEFALAAQKDKAVTVLCFWTTWAGPCRLTLPMLEKLVHAYRDKGVVLAAINQKESESDIRDFLKAVGAAVPVALDKESDAAELYQVAGIPEIVVVDKVGVVREVYVGYGKGLEDELRVLLDSLTAVPAPKK